MSMPANDNVSLQELWEAAQAARLRCTWSERSEDLEAFRRAYQRFRDAFVAADTARAEVKVGSVAR